MSCWPYLLQPLLLGIFPVPALLILFIVPKVTYAKYTVHLASLYRKLRKYTYSPRIPDIFGTHLLAQQRIIIFILTYLSTKLKIALT